MGKWIKLWVLVTFAFSLSRCQHDEFLPVQRARAFAVPTNTDVNRPNKPISTFAGLRPLSDGNEREIFDEVSQNGISVDFADSNIGRGGDPDSYDDQISELNQERPLFIPRIYRNDTDETKAATLAPIVETTTQLSRRTFVPAELQSPPTTLSPLPQTSPPTVELPPEPLPTFQPSPPSSPVRVQPQPVVVQPPVPISSTPVVPLPPAFPQQSRNLPSPKSELRPIWMPFGSQIDSVSGHQPFSPIPRPQPPPQPVRPAPPPPPPPSAPPIAQSLPPLPQMPSRPPPTPPPPAQPLPPAIWTQLSQLPPVRQPMQVRPLPPSQPQFQSNAQSRMPFRPPQPMTQIRRPPRPPTNLANRRLQHDPTGQRTGVCHNTIFYTTAPIESIRSQPHFTHFAIAVSVDQCARTCHEFNCAVAHFDPVSGRCQFVPATSFGVRREQCPSWPSSQYLNNVDTGIPIRIDCVTCQRPLRPRPPLSPPRMRRPNMPPQNQVVAVRRPQNHRRFEPTVIGMTFMANSPMRAMMFRQPQSVAVSFDVPTPKGNKDSTFRVPFKKIEATSAQGFEGQVARRGRFLLRGRNEHRVLPQSVDRKPDKQDTRRIIDSVSQNAAKLVKETQATSLTRSSGNVRMRAAPTRVMSRKSEPLKELNYDVLHHN